MTHRQPPRRGISLIEALVAMAVMAFGMLGVVGLQATLRANSDLAKQRSEAVRIAQETIEQWRRFSVLANDAEHTSADFPNTYAGIGNIAASTITGYTTNATYTRTGTVNDTDWPGQKVLQVDVSWTDRGGTTQNVRLFSSVARIAPELGATFVAPPTGGLVREPGGRSRGIPPMAKNFGDGTSGFRPPQGGGTVAWLFNNVTGLITHICTTLVTDNALLVRADLTACDSTTPHQLISGFVRFIDDTTQPSIAIFRNPTDTVPAEAATLEVQVLATFPSTATVGCFEDFGSNYISYYCAVPVSTTSSPVLAWSGRLSLSIPLLTLAPNIASNSSSQGKVCRYRANGDYTEVTTPQANENLVLMRAGSGFGTGFSCVVPDSTSTVTWHHQPAS